MPERNLPRLTLLGVDHTARPTWRLRETVEFYRDKLGLPLVHVISARGWGPTTHPDLAPKPNNKHSENITENSGDLANIDEYGFADD